jgi:uncharacterized protein
MKNKLKYLLLLTLFTVHYSLFTIPCFSQGIPDKPNPPRLVNDYAGMLSAQELVTLEQNLDRFNDSTSTQIVIVIVNTFNGLDRMDFAQQLGAKWGVGQKSKNNGLVMAISKGERKIGIATGYGMEGIIPDATCKLIIENEMRPHFAKGDYYGGINSALKVIMALSKKEYPASAYVKKFQNRGNDGSKAGGIIVILIIIFIVFIAKLTKTATHYSSNKKIPFWTLFWIMMFASRSSGGHWNDFSSGRGGFGGGGGFSGGGGFGGFGGGGFGGGGAGGGW